MKETESFNLSSIQFHHLLFFISICIIIVFILCHQTPDFASLIYPVFQNITIHYSFLANNKPPILFYIYNITHHLDRKLIPSYIGHVNFPESISNVLMFDYYISHIIKNSDLFTSDAKNADIFLISTVLSMYYSLKMDYKNLTINIVKKKKPNLYKFHGLDYILLQNTFSSHKTPIQENDEMEFPGMISLGDILWEYSVTSPREALRNTVIPYASRSPYGLLSHERNISIYFLGTIDLPVHHGSDLGMKVRTGMKNIIHNFPGSLFIQTVRLHPQKAAELYGSKIQEYMRNSSFCLVPHGDSPSSKRLIDAIRSLCIPIILSDMIRFPFEEVFIDYKKFVIHVPMFSPEVIPHIINLYNKEIELNLRRNELIKVRRMFDVNVYARLVPGEQAWIWIWMHYIKITNIKSCMRRKLLKSIYYR
ncbi:Exostosin family protein [Tritrichomonas foetus]|uniref:Exostosin family protein n=1 Tax=Tritrichomonas foetus TaxID=1144522 RepID=A0A1J4J2W0_9EUKA|nr:Exostosin family protein [Tritrichomonas foetus]|eukprot:OHS93792.1 Exostosin family protein [Tritrichomonas foetus]